jgi:hypothetical protein
MCRQDLAAASATGGHGDVSLCARGWRIRRSRTPRPRANRQQTASRARARALRVASKPIVLPDARSNPESREQIFSFSPARPTYRRSAAAASANEAVPGHDERARGSPPRATATAAQLTRTRGRLLQRLVGRRSLEVEPLLDKRRRSSTFGRMRLHHIQSPNHVSTPMCVKRKGPVARRGVVEAKAVEL